MEPKRLTNKRIVQSQKKRYWTKRDQAYLEEGRQKAIMDRLYYYPNSHEAKETIQNTLEEVRINKSYSELVSQNQEVALAAIRRYLLKAERQCRKNSIARSALWNSGQPIDGVADRTKQF